MGQNAKATDFLKECMADALIQKMQEKPFEKVTVNEIADLAGVNRSTWFRNFKTKMMPSLLRLSFSGTDTEMTMVSHLKNILWIMPGIFRIYL